MSAIKRTDWYPGSVKPCADRPGPYERDWQTLGGPRPDVWKDYWDGSKWFITAVDLNPSSYQALPWREVMK